MCGRLVVEHNGQICAILPIGFPIKITGKIGALKCLILLVPGERFELPTNGLQKIDRALPGVTSHNIFHWAPCGKWLFLLTILVYVCGCK